MPALGMSLLTVHLWLDRRFVKPDVLDFKIALLGDIIEKAAELGIKFDIDHTTQEASCPAKTS